MGKDTNRHLTKENTHMKKCSVPLAIEEMQIKMNMRYYNKPFRRAKIKNNDNIKCQWGCREIRSLIHCWWENRIAQPLWRILWQFLIKLSLHSRDDPAAGLLDIYPQEIKTYVH